MAKHTEGPWEAVEHSWAEIGIYAGDKRIAGLSIADEATEETEAMLGAQMEANARLMTAAPELLAALQGVVAVADRATDEFDRAREAIAKATGA